MYTRAFSGGLEKIHKTHPTLLIQVRPLWKKA